VSDTSRLLASVKLAEGFRASPYEDTRGLWSVGIGTCLETNPLTAEQWRWLLSRGELSVTISEAGAEYLMGAALETVERACATSFRFWTALNDARQNVIIEMGYNLGMSRLLGFHEMLDALAAADYVDAAHQMLDSLWAHQVASRAERLAQQMRTGAFV